MVMLYVQKDGTMGPQNPANITNQNSTVAQANSGSILRNNKINELLGLQSAGQQALTPKEEKPGTGANRVAAGSLGNASGMGVAGDAQAGLVGSVNTEVQNDDMILPYTKV